MIKPKKPEAKYCQLIFPSSASLKLLMLLAVGGRRGKYAQAKGLYPERIAGVSN
jgi:hypothetical protein